VAPDRDMAKCGFDEKKSAVSLASLEEVLLVPGKGYKSSDLFTFWAFVHIELQLAKW
jgi:hypothetical protein